MSSSPTVTRARSDIYRAIVIHRDGEMDWETWDIDDGPLAHIEKHYKLGRLPISQAEVVAALVVEPDHAR